LLRFAPQRGGAKQRPKRSFYHLRKASGDMTFLGVFVLQWQRLTPFDPAGREEKEKREKGVRVVWRVFKN